MLYILIAARRAHIVGLSAMAAASDALFVPAVMTLAILGVFIVLRRLVSDIYAPTWVSEGEAGP